MLRIATPLSEELENVIHRTIGCCITVHKTLGPGLLERIYVRAVCMELAAQDIPFEREKRFPVSYRGELLWHQRIDLVIDRQLIVEIKSVAQLAPLHRGQVLTYLRVAKLSAGLLINFNVAVLPDGLRRVVL